MKRLLYYFVIVVNNIVRGILWGISMIIIGICCPIIWLSDLRVWTKMYIEMNKTRKKEPKSCYDRWEEWHSNEYWQDHIW